MSPTVHSTTESEVPTALRLRGDVHGWTLYVIDLQKTVLLKRAFEIANPGYMRGKPCVYVGLTVKTAEERYKEHKAGIHDGRFVKECGRRLRVNDCRRLRSMTRKRAEKKEAALCIEAARAGLGRVVELTNLSSSSQPTA